MRLYFRPKLYGCHTVKVPTKCHLLILALTWTTFAGVTVLLETLLYLRLAHRPCAIEQPTTGTNHFLVKVPLLFTVFSTNLLSLFKSLS